MDTNEATATVAEQQPAVPVNNIGKIVLEFWTEGDDRNIKKSFFGEWLVGDDSEGVNAEDTGNGISWCQGWQYSVARTKKGSLVLYVQHKDGSEAPSMHVYEDFDAMKVDQNTVPENVIAETAAALDLEYEIKLDI